MIDEILSIAAFICMVIGLVVSFKNARIGFLFVGLGFSAFALSGWMESRGNKVWLLMILAAIAFSQSIKAKRSIKC